MQNGKKPERSDVNDAEFVDTAEQNSLQAADKETNEALTSKVKDKISKLSERGEIERLRNIGKGLDVVRGFVNGGIKLANTIATIKKIDAQTSQVEKNIELVEANTELARTQRKGTANQIENTINPYVKLVREDLPVFLDAISDFSPSDKAEIVKAVLQKYPATKIDIK